MFFKRLHYEQNKTVLSPYVVCIFAAWQSHPRNVANLKMKKALAWKLGAAFPFSLMNFRPVQIFVPMGIFPRILALLN
jgi:hypothetical protein